MNNISKHFENINKLIFVHQYDEAFSLMEAFLFKEKIVCFDLVYHLRYIELSIKLNKIELILEQYKDVENVDKDFSKLCLNFIKFYQLKSDIEDIFKTFSSLQNSNYQCGAYYGMGLSSDLLGETDKAILYYEKSLTIDPKFYPSYFALSQIYYNLSDVEKGNENFFLFESLAKYNIYGNFGTHVDVAKYFLEEQKYNLAEIAITTLSNWWVDNKGYCPFEVQIYENFFISDIYSHIEEKQKQSLEKKELAMSIAENALNLIEKEDILFFIAKTLEENRCLELSLKYYEKILKISCNSEIIQRIGSYFLSTADFETLDKLFDKAYEYNPDSLEIRFFRLVSLLYKNHVDLEEYLSKKEMLLKLYSYQANSNIGFNQDNVMEGFDCIDAISNFNKLTLIFDQDSDIHRILGGMYEKINDVEKAYYHYKKMYELDPLGKNAIFSYVSFLLKNNKEDANDKDENIEAILNFLEDRKNLTKLDKIELYNLISYQYYIKENYEKSYLYTSKILLEDSWNHTALIRGILNLIKINKLETEINGIDNLLLNYKMTSFLELDEFDKKTYTLEKKGFFPIAYLRRKLSLLLSNGNIVHLNNLVTTAMQYDCNIGIKDLMKLINTNFDSLYLYIGLGLLNKEIWQLQTACMWFEYVLDNNSFSDIDKAKSYFEIADALVWQDKDLEKALQYAKMALDLEPRYRNKIFIVLTHIYLKQGNIKEALKYSVELDKFKTMEVLYLKGMIEYRNGKVDSAKKIWKPMIKVAPSSIKDYYIKQDILSYYFDKKNYKYILDDSKSFNSIN